MTKEYQDWVDDLMTQVQVYASAWAGYTRTFAVGKAFDDYVAAGNELRALVLAKFAERQPTSQDVGDREMIKTDAKAAAFDVHVYEGEYAHHKTEYTFDENGLAKFAELILARAHN